MKQLSVAIDGPAGAGKSTVARQVAKQLGLIYVDTGAMYRAITWKALTHGVDLTHEETVTQMAQRTDIRLSTDIKGSDVWVDGTTVTEEIRSPEVTAHVSTIAGQSKVREVLVDKQREMGRKGGVVMDGRDIGTHVLPDAEVKVFLTASIEERARRRYQEMIRRGYEVDLEELKEEIGLRDEKDKNREHSPLRPAEDAIHLDTTGLSIDDVISRILHLCRTNLGGEE
ncbi:(d)CMP kinase [Marininema halotolerans]|uniref:Cytidylate kinase n=1 Tax=Marininema halotolerans TaxID=1155944 RepID=A0A1I6TY72_9BACL|nr:(d)CMP kinase [Marininema halotolerans]SFS94084.1 cytidylate kinase [Marininema halotolerans]